MLVLIHKLCCGKRWLYTCSFTSFSVITFLFVLVGCSNSKDVVDSWSGLNDLIIEDPSSGRALENSFRLNSNLVLPKIDGDTSYAIVSHCRVPVSDLENSALKNSKFKKTIKVFSKTKSYSPDDNPHLKPLPVINHLNDMVFIYPELFIDCDFTLQAKNAVGSTDSSTVKNAKFEYNKSDHEIGINTSLIDFQEMRSTLLFESYSKLSADYIGELEPEEIISPEMDANGFTNANESTEIKPPEPTIKDAKIMCYTNEIKETALKVDSDGQTFSLGNPVDKFHSATVNIPAENCVFVAFDRNNKRITSQTFDIVHNLRTHESAVDISFQFDYEEFGKVSLDQKAYSDSIDGLIREPLITLTFVNTSDETRLFKFDTAYSQQTNHSFIIADKKALERKANDNEGRFSRISYEMILKEQTSVLSWEGERIDINNGLITLPEKSETSVTLIYETERDFTGELGLLIAPKAVNPIFNFSGLSKNEFKETPIAKGNLKAFFFPNRAFSNVIGYSGEEHQDILDESLFSQVLRNENHDKVSFSKVIDAQITPPYVPHTPLKTVPH